MQGIKYKFILSDKVNLEQLLPDLFRILHSNMSLIAPTGCLYEDDYEMWSSCIIPAMEKEARQIALMYSEGRIVGYFQYYINLETKSLMMEEIQILKEHQGTGIFADFYKWLVRHLSDDIVFVEAYAHKNNIKSQGILKNLGLTCSGENKNGNSFYYKGRYADLLSKYLQEK